MAPGHPSPELGFFSPGRGGTVSIFEPVSALASEMRLGLRTRLHSRIRPQKRAFFWTNALGLKILGL
jgi:hypothetical protein